MREDLLDQLDATVHELIVLFQTSADPETAVYDGWSAIDVLGHITFWHESFARNVEDMATGDKPTPLRGRLSDLNQCSINEMRECSLETIINRLDVAQQVIRNHILDAKISSIPYRKGSRDYTPEEHLDIVNKHIIGHLRAIKSSGEVSLKHPPQIR